MKSMTAFGSASCETISGRILIEIHSVNRKSLDLSLFLPRGFLSWDVGIRKQLSQEISRGQVTFRFSLSKEGKEGADLKKLKKDLEDLAFALSYPLEVVTLPFLLEQRDKKSTEDSFSDSVDFKTSFESCLMQALRAFQTMRSLEGNALKKDLEGRIDLLKDLLFEIEKRGHAPLDKYRKKIEEKLLEFSSCPIELQEKLGREVALLAEKLDVTEEIVRLRSHFDQFLPLLSEDKSVGRTLEFLTQEMNREINTMGSKSADIEISTFVVKMKSELEKIREQVQNIE